MSKAFLIFSSILIITLLSCQQQAKEYKEVSSQVKYKFLKFGEGEEIRNSSVILSYFTVLDTAGDTLHYVPNYPYFKEVSNHPIDSVWLNLHEGDSVHIICSRKLFNQYLRLYGPMQSDEGWVELRSGIVKSLSKKEGEKYRQELLSDRELKEQKELQAYLSKFSSADQIERLEDVYRIRDFKGRGDSLSYGDEITISYRGKFLNGYVFDDTENKGLSPTFKYGEEDQLIEGIESGLKGLKEGESVKIILPSRRAFGEEGSLAGIVPPYTTVVFDLKILNIKK